MSRISKQQVRGALNRYLRAWASLGYNLELQYQEGGSGCNYTIRLRSGSNAPGTSDGYLGRTSGEAWDTLCTIARTIEDMNHIRSTSNETQEVVYFKNSDGTIAGYEAGMD